MSNRKAQRRFALHTAPIWMVLAALVLGTVSPALAGLQRSSAVGGISINAEGLLAAPQIEDQKALKAERERALQPQAGDLKQFTPLRKLSLRQLEAAIREHRTTQVTPLPDDLKYLAGLQEIKYVFVYPEQNDIVLVGPAEGWKIDDLGNVVGLTTNRPVLQLDDLMVALRTARAARQGGINCSIDPTAEGLKNLQRLASQLKTIGNPEATMGRIEQALGPQVVSVSGVPATSHFARVMVAADFRMKRLAMNFDPSPVQGMPSFLQMMSAGSAGMSNMLPRWWLAPKAEPLLTDAEGLAWEIRGFGVQCMTEEDFVAKDGTRQQGVNKGGQVAKRWADNFTAKYAELSKKDSVFGELRNVMELAVVAALIENEHLIDRVNLEAPRLLSEEGLEEYDAPRQVDSRASFVKKGRNWLISASGGVQLYPAEVVQNPAKTEALAPVRQAALGSGMQWWWN